MAAAASALVRADAEFVRTATGYAIGGVPPLGHAEATKVLLDDGLRRFDVVWAAGGTPFSVFPIGPARLRDVTGAPWADVSEDS